MKILTLIPVYNEEKSITSVINELKGVSDNWDLLVINDGSNDSTAEILKQNGVDFINLPFNTGYGCALQTGFKYAYNNGYDYVMHIDGDGQHDPGYLPELLQLLIKKNADIVLGSRFLIEDKSKKYKISYPRKFFIFIMKLLIRIFANLKITDPTSGYVGINKRVLEYFISEDYPFDYPDADVIIKLHKKGFLVREIPVQMYNLKSNGKIHNGIKPVYYVFKMCLSIFISAINRKQR